MTSPPTSRFRALAETAAPNATVGGLREGVWNAASPLRAESRTTYVRGCPDGPFYWPGPPKRGWVEGMLKPIDGPSDRLDLWVRRDAEDVLRRGHGPSVAVELRTFYPEGQCGREALNDEQGRYTRVRSWNPNGVLTQEQHYVAGVPQGVWGFLRGKSWRELQLNKGRVVFDEREAGRLGKLFTKTAVEWGDPEKLAQVVIRELGHDDLFGEALMALVRSGDLDPLSSENLLMILSDWPGARASDVDALLKDARPYPSIPQLLLLAGWPNSIDRVVARALPSRPLEEWLDLARKLPSERRCGLLFLLRRFGAELTPEETEEVGVALLDACGPIWDYQRIPVVGPPEDGLTLQMFKGPARAKILALFGL